MSEPTLSVLREADSFVQSIVDKADVATPFPLWHGWALRDAYFAGHAAGFRAGIEAAAKACEDHAMSGNVPLGQPALAALDCASAIRHLRPDEGGQ